MRFLNVKRSNLIKCSFGVSSLFIKKTRVLVFGQVRQLGPEGAWLAQNDRAHERRHLAIRARRERQDIYVGQRDQVLQVVLGHRESHRLALQSRRLHAQSAHGSAGQFWQGLSSFSTNPTYIFINEILFFEK